jgi:hypothetical protein
VSRGKNGGPAKQTPTYLATHQALLFVMFCAFLGSRWGDFKNNMHIFLQEARSPCRKRFTKKSKKCLIIFYQRGEFKNTSKTFAEKCLPKNRQKDSADCFLICLLAFLGVSRRGSKKNAIEKQISRKLFDPVIFLASDLPTHGGPRLFFSGLAR